MGEPEESKVLAMLGVVRGQTVLVNEIYEIFTLPSILVESTSPQLIDRGGMRRKNVPLIPVAWNTRHASCFRNIGKHVDS